VSGAAICISCMFMLKALCGDGTVSPALESHPDGTLADMRGVLLVSGLCGIVSAGGLCLGDSDGNMGLVCVADQILSSFLPTVVNWTEFA
jgi:hypothetical protein